jgi:aminoglycoside 6'-N-acetyltransferase I
MASAFVLHKPDGDTWLYVDEVDVCADKQQKGVGKAIMLFLFEYGKDNHCDEVWLGTEKDNVAANALYKSLQPAEIENFVGYLYK